ncbi:YncE family protein [Acidicapsa ligni]|uniref:YncE family protein n=1 Tax=Acidicapsa ligni TaxID=542300 RepID=UPI0021DF6713|nr:hypothetical protein [Acidicapsa ligni]
MKRILAFCLACCATLAAQEPPKATDLPAHPFFIKTTWRIGGEGVWGNLAIDSKALQLYIAHGSVVQIVDLNAGKLMGVVPDIGEAHSVALEDSGQYGYVTDGQSSQVKVFDRRMKDVVANIRSGPSPQAIVFDPVTATVFAICASIASDPAQTTGPTRSVVTVIDSTTNTRIGDLLLAGRLSFAQTDRNGQIFVNIVDQNEIDSFDTQTVVAKLRELARATETEKAKHPSTPLPVLDWSGSSTSSQASSQIHRLHLGSDCNDPQGMAIDKDQQRLFVGCSNLKMLVLDASRGTLITSLPIGPGVGGIGFDPTRGLIYSANGAGLGSLTVIQQHISDSYDVVQDLPTRSRANTLAVNSENGEVYLVTDIEGFDTTHSGGIGSLRVVPMKGSFQTLVVGN